MFDMLMFFFRWFSSQIWAPLPIDFLLKHENSNAHVIVYALGYIGDHWPNDRIQSSAKMAADNAGKWLAGQGVHKTAPSGERNNADVSGLGSAKSLQMQSLEIAIEQLREM